MMNERVKVNRGSCNQIQSSDKILIVKFELFFSCGHEWATLWNGQANIWEIWFGQIWFRDMYYDEEKCGKCYQNVIQRFWFINTTSITTWIIKFEYVKIFDTYLLKMLLRTAWSSHLFTAWAWLKQSLRCKQVRVEPDFYIFLRPILKS